MKEVVNERINKGKIIQIVLVAANILLAAYGFFSDLFGGYANSDLWGILAFSATSTVLIFVWKIASKIFVFVIVRIIVCIVAGVLVAMGFLCITNALALIPLLLAIGYLVFLIFTIKDKTKFIVEENE